MKKLPRDGRPASDEFAEQEPDLPRHSLVVALSTHLLARLAGLGAD
jgi:hypothetical protein